MNQQVKQQCTLTDEELVTRTEELVSELAKTGGKSWVLQVPVNFNKDPDMIFLELAKRLKERPVQSDAVAEGRFAEWCSSEGWQFSHTRQAWHNEDKPVGENVKTTAELKGQFINETQK